MDYVIQVHTYDGLIAKVTIPPEVVDNLYLVLHYYISGDEVYVFVKDDGSLLTIDAEQLIPDAHHREMGLGPDELTVIFPEDMVWDSVYEA